MIEEIGIVVEAFNIIKSIVIRQKTQNVFGKCVILQLSYNKFFMNFSKACEENK